MRSIDPFKRTERALSAFSKAVDELSRAAADHQAVADLAYAEAQELMGTATRNTAAAHQATRRADKIAEFLA